MPHLVITLTQTTREDLRTLFHFQQDQKAAYVAAFTSPDSEDQTAYLKKYSPFLTEPTITMRTINANEEIAGSIAKFVRENKAEVTYWIDRKWWGQGIATRALTQLLALEPSRPLYGRVAFDNYGSQHVLENCGFVKIGSETGFANARQTEIEEYIYQLLR